MNSDREQLRLLSIFHYVVGGLLALCALIPSIHVVLGWMMVFRPKTFGAGETPPPVLGWVFMVIGATCIVVGLTLAILTFVAGQRLGQLRSRKFCLVVAAVLCVFMPFGTALGVLTIIVLSRSSVQQLFAETVPQ